jgi:hypothetical protein
LLNEIGPAGEPGEAGETLVAFVLLH